MSTFIITAWRPSELGERGRKYDDYIDANIPMDSIHADIEDQVEADGFAKALTLIGWDVMVEVTFERFQFSLEQVNNQGQVVGPLAPIMRYTADAQHPGFGATIEDAVVVVEQVAPSTRKID